MASENVKPPDIPGNQGDDESSMSSTVTARRVLPVEVNRSSSYFMGEKDELPIKIVGPNNEEILPEDIVMAPDGGWGWLIVFAAFMSNVIVDGTVFTFGIILAPMAHNITTMPPDTAVELKTQVPWIGGMLQGFYLSTGPFASSMSNIFGFRITAIVGSVTAFFGFFMAWLCNQQGDTEGPNLPNLYGFIGFVGGVGLCLLYVPSIITVGYYFDKKRALATGIAVCGSGVGTFVYAPVINKLLSVLKWPKTLLVEACLILSCAFIVLLYRPLKPGSRALGSTGGGSIREPVLIIPDKTMSVIIRVKHGDSRSQTGLVPEDGKSSPKDGLEVQTGDVQPNTENPVVGTAAGNASLVDLQITTSMRSTRSIKSTAPAITLLVDPSSDINIAESRVFRVASAETLNKPLHRPDIFYPGSLYPDKSEEMPQTVEWEAVPVSEPESGVLVPPPPKGKCLKCCSYTFPILRKMLDFSLLKSVTFILLAMSGGISFLGFFVPFAYIAELAIQNEVSPTLATALVAVIGGSNTIGRVICGIIADKVSNRILLINNVALTAAGLSTALVPLLICDCFSYPIFVVYACIFGGSVACFISLRSVLVVQLLGISKLTNAFGLLCLFQGMAAFVGSPVAGYLKEATSDYNASFHVAGTLMLLSGVICYPLNLINRWEKKRSREKELIKVLVS